MITNPKHDSIEKNIYIYRIMYQYNQLDKEFLKNRVKVYREQTKRYIAKELTDSEFLPLRLRNGLYVQRLAPMLRIAVPYGTLNSRQLRMLAYITRHYDKGYAHFTTRQNLQINWPKLEEVPDILDDLASVDMHAIQTSGNCVRNVTADHFSGVAADEIADARPYCELVRQWSTNHPEFDWLPRKFKIAISGSVNDRAASQVHDIGIMLVKDKSSKVALNVYVGGGLGRTPIIGTLIREKLPAHFLLTYIEAILRVYNMHGRRDNKYKARIKILVKAMGAENFKQKVDEEWEQIKDGPSKLTLQQLETIEKQFKISLPSIDSQEYSKQQEIASQNQNAFNLWKKHNTHKHKVLGYTIVSISLKTPFIAPGDISAEQIDALAEIADMYSRAEARITHHQNAVLPFVQTQNLYDLWKLLKKHGLATSNIGTAEDIICCPGGDFCSLANAKSIPLANLLQTQWKDKPEIKELGGIRINISGCMNACAHHHVGNIGILGVDKKGKEFYQISIGGSSESNASIGKIIGPSFARVDVPKAIDTILATYTKLRTSKDESFMSCTNRVGIEPFKDALYPQNEKK